MHERYFEAGIAWFGAIDCRCNLGSLMVVLFVRVVVYRLRIFRSVFLD